MSIMAEYRELYGQFKFIVSIDGVQSAGFEKCSEVGITIETMKYHEGGCLVPYKEPGLGDCEDLTLNRGMSRDHDLYDWLLDCLNIMAKLPGGISVAPPSYFRDMTIRQRRRDDVPAINFRIYWAFVTSYKGGPWDNSASGVTMDTVTVAYHHPDRQTA